MAGKTCAICGKPSGMYPLCVACMKEKNNGNVVKCEKCGAWHRASETCVCSAQAVKAPDTVKSEKTKAPEGIGQCIICGADSGSKYFCKSCYSKFKDHTILLRVTNCRDFEIEEKYADGVIYMCKDGHKVRSKSEKMIDDFLFENKISHAYEKVIDVDDAGEEQLTPDFYLNDYDAYIEHWGYDEKENPGYGKTKKYKLDIYKKKGLTIICTFESDMDNPELKLRRKLNKNNIKKGEINFDK